MYYTIELVCVETQIAFIVRYRFVGRKFQNEVANTHISKGMTNGPMKLQNTQAK